jgi:hypothetical protein
MGARRLGQGMGATPQVGRRRAGNHETGVQGSGKAAQGAGGNGSGTAALAQGQMRGILQDALIARHDILMHRDEQGRGGAQFLVERQAGFGQPYP